MPPTIPQPVFNRQVYCISGLGADERIFSKLDVPGTCFRHLHWLQPEKDEDIGHYASRMISRVPVPDPVLLGVSFGGMMAVEMAKHAPGATVILVSSVKSRQELPPWMRFFSKLNLGNSLPDKPWRLPRLENHFLGVETAEELALANEFRMHVDPVYLNWALAQVMNWPNDWQPSSLYHIHGSKDRMFPIKYLQPTHTIPGGGHFMIMNRAAEINGILTKILNGIAR
jgi:pimeloyl-ACP methyl ester carboxylesterase